MIANAMHIRFERLPAPAAIAAVMAALPHAAHAQGTPLPGMLQNPSMETNWLLLGMAILQTIIIVALAGIIRTLGTGSDVWVRYLKGRRAAMVLVLLAAGTGAAHAATPAAALITSQELFYWLLAANLFLFVIIVAQLVVLSGMVRHLLPEREPAAKPEEERHSWADKVLQVLTRRPSMEKEKDLLMHHDYDGIRELDNVLPPWWLWLFYGTIAWSVLYLVQVHVTQAWPDQDEAYVLEVEQAKAEVEAYLALQKAAVDENTVTALTDGTTLAQGNAIFQEFCKACHGALGEGNAVGPNLTDRYWLHGGSINDVFRTIKYGVAEKGMQSWKNELSPVQMQAVASYILSLQGSEPPNAKPPQGELYEPPGGGAAPAGGGNAALPAR